MNRARLWLSLTPAGFSALGEPVPSSRPDLADLAERVRTHVPLPPSAYLHGAEPHPSSPTLPGLDLDARGVVARRPEGAPVGAALVPAFDARRAALLEHARDVAADLRDES